MIKIVCYYKTIGNINDYMTKKYNKTLENYEKYFNFHTIHKIKLSIQINFYDTLILLVK